MDTPAPKVQFGQLHQVVGVAARHGRYVFTSAIVELDGSSFSSEHPLAEFVPGRLPAALAEAAAGGFDVAWVWGRVSRVFRFAPVPSETEKTLLEQGFVATTADLATAYPFVCTDYYGRTALMFSANGPPADVRRSIAQDFWGLLLADPSELSDFGHKVYHPGTGVYMYFGCKRGRPCYSESHD